MAHWPENSSLKKAQSVNGLERSEPELLLTFCIPLKKKRKEKGHR